MTDFGTIETTHFDYGTEIGIAVTRNGVRRIVRVNNPFANEISAELQSSQVES